MTMESWIAIPMINLAAVGAMMTVGWIFSVLHRNVTIVDSLWGLGFVLVAGVTFWTGSGFGGRSLLILVLTAGWGLRLAGYLTRRNWGQPEDHRYGQWREKSGKALLVRQPLQGVLASGDLSVDHLPGIAESAVVRRAVPNHRAGHSRYRGVVGWFCFRVGRGLAAGPVQSRSEKPRPSHGSRPVGMEPPPQLLRRIFNLVGFLPGGPGHTGRVVDNYQSYNYFHGAAEDDRGATDRSSP